LIGRDHGFFHEAADDAGFVRCELNVQWFLDRLRMRDAS